MVVGVDLHAQSDPQFTQYTFLSNYINPAASGFHGKSEVTALYRTQWAGYTGTFDAGGAPNTQLINASVPMPLLKGGLGVYFSNDLAGASVNREFSLSYSFHKRVGSNLIGVGAAAGVHNRSLNAEKYRPREPNDPIIPVEGVGQTLPDFSAGVFLYNPVYQLGLSLKHLNQPSFGFNTENGQSVLPRSLFITGSVLLGLSYTMDLSPMFIIKSDFNTVSTEIGALLTYNSKYWGGLNYRWQDAASFLIGGNFLNNTIKAGYAVDWIVFGNVAKAPTSHELFITYSLNPPRSGKKSIIRTPRYRF